MPVGNLEFIKSASGTSVSSLSVTDCFSADYDVYQVLVSNIDQATAQYFWVRLIDSGGVDSTSNYDDATLIMKPSTTFGQERNANQNAFTRFLYNSTGTTGGNLNLYVYNPYDSSSYTFLGVQGIGEGLYWGSKGIGVHTVAEQITGIHFLAGAGNLDNIDVSVYGVK